MITDICSCSAQVGRTRLELAILRWRPYFLRSTRRPTISDVAHTAVLLPKPTVPPMPSSPWPSPLTLHRFTCSHRVCRDPYPRRTSVVWLCNPLHARGSSVKCSKFVHHQTTVQWDCRGEFLRRGLLLSRVLQGRRVLPLACRHPYYAPTNPQLGPVRSVLVVSDFIMD